MTENSSFSFSLFRKELIHPMVAHFPVALILTAALFALMSFIFIKHERIASFFKTPRIVVLFLGVLGAWAGILTGDFAEDVVNKVICDPTVTKVHESWAFAAAWVATTALAFEGLAFILKKNMLSLMACFLMIASGGLVAYTGHLGASLVYQQAAGVYRPSTECSEFE